MLSLHEWYGISLTKTKYYEIGEEISKTETPGQYAGLYIVQAPEILRKGTGRITYTLDSYIIAQLPVLLFHSKTKWKRK